ncbi:hypothetical protein SCB49_03864 [unidentified eubacterium SCB49]|nr:hypothetical protein SCB49_03864 [unidentified eubacterium SCB49]
MKIFFPFLLVALAVISCNDSNKKDLTVSEVNKQKNVLTTAERIATKNGFDKFELVNQIDFTFNVDRGDSHFERSWQWRPKDNTVSKTVDNEVLITYNRKDIDSTLQEYDSAFINDKYWLLAPLNLIRDEGITFSETKKAKAPISGKETNLLTITYSNKGGYTPGDAYDLYFGDNFLLEEWVFRKGNDSVPTMATTWEDYKDFSGLKIAKMHKDSLGDFKVYFTDINVN